MTQFDVGLLMTVVRSTCVSKDPLFLSVLEQDSVTQSLCLTVGSDLNAEVPFL